MSAPEPTAEDRDIQARLGSWARSLLARASGRALSLPAAARRPMSLSTGGTLALVQRLALPAGAHRIWQPQGGPALPQALDRFAAGVAGRYELNAGKYQPRAPETKEQGSELVLAFPGGGGEGAGRETSASEVMRETLDPLPFLSSEPPGAPPLGDEPASQPVTFGPPPWERQAGGPAARMAQRRAGVRPVSRVEEITPGSRQPARPPAVTDAGPTPSAVPPAAGESESTPAGTSLDEESDVAPAPAAEPGAAGPPVQRRQEPPRSGGAGQARPPVRRRIDEAPTPAGSQGQELSTPVERAEPRPTPLTVKDGRPGRRESVPEVRPLPSGPPAAPAVRRRVQAGPAPAPGVDATPPPGELQPAAGEVPTRAAGEEPASQGAGPSPAPQTGGSAAEERARDDAQGARTAPSLPLQPAGPPDGPAPAAEGGEPGPAVQRHAVAPDAPPGQAGPDAGAPQRPTTTSPVPTVQRRTQDAHFQEESGLDVPRPVPSPATGSGKVSGEEPILRAPEPGIRRRPLEQAPAPAADATPAGAVGPEVDGVRSPQPPLPPATELLAGLPDGAEAPRLQRQAGEPPAAGDVRARPPKGAREELPLAPPAAADGPAGPGHGQPGAGSRLPCPPPPSSPAEARSPVVARAAAPPLEVAPARMPGADPPAEAPGAPVVSEAGSPPAAGPSPASVEDPREPADLTPALDRRRGGADSIPGPAMGRGQPPVPDEGGPSAAPDLPVRRHDREMAPPGPAPEPPAEPIVQRTARTAPRPGPGREGGAQPGPQPAPPRDLPLAAVQGEADGVAPAAPVDDRPGAAVHPSPAGEVRPSRPDGKAELPLVEDKGPDVGPDQARPAAADASPAAPPAPAGSLQRQAAESEAGGMTAVLPATPAEQDRAPFADLPPAKSGAARTSFAEGRAPGRPVAAGLEGDGRALQLARSRDVTIPLEPEGVGPVAVEQAEGGAPTAPSLRRRAGEPLPAAGEGRGAAGSPGGEPPRDEPQASPRAMAVQAGPPEAEAQVGQERSGPRALPAEPPAPAVGAQRRAEPEGQRSVTASEPPGLVRQPEPPAARSREQLPLVERRAQQGGARVQASRDQAAGHGLPERSPVGPAAPVSRSLDGPLPLAPRVVQRQPVAAEAVSDLAAPVKVVQRVVEDTGAQEPGPSLEELARRVYPFVKRLLALECERLPR